MSLNNGMDVAGDNAGVKEDIPVSNIAGVSAAAIDAIPVDPSEAWAAGTQSAYSAYMASIALLLMLIELWAISLSLCAYVSVMVIILGDGSYSIEWCTEEPMPVFCYRVVQQTISLA